MCQQLSLPIFLPNFKSVIAYLRTVPSISMGGCGVAVLAMYRWLKLNEPHRKVQIVFGYTSWSDELRINNSEWMHRCSTDRPQPEPANHCWLLIDGKPIDAEGDTRFYFSRHHIVPLSLLIGAIKNKSKWNDYFNREEWMPQIEKKLGVSLADIKN